MDTITHALSGAVLGAALPGTGADGLSRRSRAAAGALAAAFPDSDFVIGFFADPLAYLNLHRGVTHSLLLLPVWALLLGWLLALFWRRADRWREFTLISALALLAHIGGDLITSYGTRILAPLDWSAFAFPITFIIDPLFTGILLAGLVLAWWRRSALPARVSGVLLLAYLGLQTVFHFQAQAIAGHHAAALPGRQEVRVYPQPLSPLHWKLVLIGDTHYRQSWLALGADAPRRAPEDASVMSRVWANYQPAGALHWQQFERAGSRANGDFARAAWGRPGFAGFRAFAALPYVYREENSTARRCAWFSDLRFQVRGVTPPFRYGMCRQGTDWELARLGRW